MLGVLNYILVQLGGEMINVGPLSFLKQLVGSDIFSAAVTSPSGRVLPFGPARSQSEFRSLLNLKNGLNREDMDGY